MKTAFLFPGQGSQVPGMGKGLYEAFPGAKGVFEKARELTGRDVAGLCFEGTQEELNETVNTQIAVYTVSMAAAQALLDQGIAPDCCAGFSLGEYAALTVSGVMSLKQGFAVVQKRGELMQEAAKKNPGVMYAVLGLDNTKIEEICLGFENVYPVNYNCPGQLVIAGEKEQATKAAELCKEAGAKRALPLPVSGPFHTPMMREAAEALAEFVAAERFAAPSVPVYTNITAEPLPAEIDMARQVRKHMQSPVRWQQTIENMRAAGITRYIEVGTGRTLQGFLKKTDSELLGFLAGTPEDIEKI